MKLWQRFKKISKNIRTRNRGVNKTEKSQIRELAYSMSEKDGMNHDEKYYWYKAEKKFYSPLWRIYRVIKSGLFRFILLIVNVTLSVVLFSLFFPQDSPMSATILSLVTGIFSGVLLERLIEKKEIKRRDLFISCIVLGLILLIAPKPVSEWSFQRGNCFNNPFRQEELKKKNLKNCQDFPLYVNQVNLAEAEKSYLYAIQLNPNKVEAHYNLGGLYEDWGDLKSAERHYVIAINTAKYSNISNAANTANGTNASNTSNAANDTNAIKDWDGLIEAHNNLARLYILNKENERAILLLDKAESLITDHPLKNIEPDKKDSEKLKILVLNRVEYTIYKNYGWAYFNLGDYEEASKRLKDYAIPIIEDNQELQNITPNYGAAYCLLAQVQEAQKQKEKARYNYKKCEQWGNERAEYFELQPEEFTWVEKAKNKLKNP